MEKTSKFLERAKKLKDIPTSDFLSLLKKAHKDKKAPILRAKCYYDLKFFAEYFFKEKVGGEWKGHVKDPFNKMHLDFFKNFHPEEKDLRKVILAARGSAKTTLVCVIYVLHKICYSNEKYILLLSSTSPLARAKTKDIHVEVNFNEKLKTVYGLDFGDKRTSKESFVVNSIYGECFVHSQSFFSQIRGTKYKDQRLTLVILDDVVHGEEVFSEEQRIKAERQFHTDIRQASQPGTNFIFIGTRIHNDDLGSTLARDPTWFAEEHPAFIKWPQNMSLWEEWENIMKDPTEDEKIRVVNADKFYLENEKKMTEGAEVLWPEREPVLYLMKERLSIGRRAFGAEKQMIAFLTGESLFENISWFYPTEKDGVYGYYLPKHDKFIPYNEHRFVKYYALDPATGERKKQTQKKTLSKSARIIAMKDTTKKILYVLDAFMDRKPPSQIIYEMYDLHHHHDFHKMGFEENLFRDLFKDHIHLTKKKWEEDHKTYLELPAVSRYNKVDKEQRIYGLEPWVSSGKIIFNKHINPEFVAQLQTYPNCNHNDGLDALEIMWQISMQESGFRGYNFE